jgi:hypothetical protein
LGRQSTYNQDQSPNTSSSPFRTPASCPHSLPSRWTPYRSRPPSPDQETSDPQAPDRYLLLRILIHPFPARHRQQTRRREDRSSGGILSGGMTGSFVEFRELVRRLSEEILRDVLPDFIFQCTKSTIRRIFPSITPRFHPPHSFLTLFCTPGSISR